MRKPVFGYQAPVPRHPRLPGSGSPFRVGGEEDRRSDPGAERQQHKKNGSVQQDQDPHRRQQARHRRRQQHRQSHWACQRLRRGCLPGFEHSPRPQRSLPASMPARGFVSPSLLSVLGWKHEACRRN